MPSHDLAGSPLPESGGPPPAPRLDLAGNPLPTQAPAPASSPEYQPPLRPVPTFPSEQITRPEHPSRPAYAPTTAPEGGNKKLIVGLIAGGLSFVLAFVVVFLLTPKHAFIPTAFTTFVPTDKSFSCDQPVGWTTTAADSDHQIAGKDSTTNGVLFTSGSAQIDVTTDTMATLIAYDLMHNSGETLSVAGSRVGVLHKQWKTSTSAIHKGYQETPVADFQGAMDDAKLSEWTAAGNVFGLGGAVHGYRASLTGNQRTAEVVCSCSEADWPTLKPAFLRVIASVSEDATPTLPMSPPDAAAPAADAPPTTQ